MSTIGKANIAVSRSPALTLFGCVRRKISQFATHILRPHGIGPKQALIIRILGEQKESSLSQLSKATDTDPAALGRAVDSLVENGLIARTDHPRDRRRWVVSLTPKGKKLLKKVEEIFETVSKRILSPLNSKEQKEFIRLLEKIGQSFSDTELNAEQAQEKGTLHEP